jgi:hypothetical protein
VSAVGCRPLFGGGTSAVEREAPNAPIHGYRRHTRTLTARDAPDAILSFYMSRREAQEGPPLVTVIRFKPRRAESRRREVGARPAEFTTQGNNKAAVTESRPLTCPASFDIRRSGNPAAKPP